MKTRSVILFVLVIACISSGAAYADFRIETDLKSVDFGAMDPGQIKADVPSQGIVARCTTDQGNAWSLRIRLELPLTSSRTASARIGNENFWWYGVDTSGNPAALVRQEQDFLSERVAYQAQAGEGGQGVDVRLKFKLIVPPHTQSGAYTTSIILTMIE